MENDKLSVVTERAEEVSKPAKQSNDAEFVDKEDSGGLNTVQQEIVEAQKGPIIVIAGPGTGKTRTLTQRIAFLIKEKGALPQNITAVTFTNKAASEMKERLVQIFAEETVGKINVGTFHKISLEILSELKEQSISQVIDEYSAIDILRQVKKELKLGISVRQLYRQISLFKSSGLAPEGDSPLAKAYHRYQEKLKLYKLMDYDDIILNTLNIFKRDDIADNTRDRFEYLLVDEFQDVNAVQYELVRLWGYKPENLFVIGDPDQAIYGFRGADHRFFFKLQDELPQSKIYRLQRNYRSTQTIVEAANSLIAHNPNRHATNILAAPKHSAKLTCIESLNEKSEAFCITREILKLVGGVDMLQAHSTNIADSAMELGETISFGEIAVLSRTTRQLNALKEALDYEGIPYRVVGEKHFIFTKAVRKVLNLLRSLSDTKHSFYFLTALKESAYNPGEDVIDELGKMLTNLDGACIEAAKSMVNADKLASRSLRKLQKFVESYDKYQKILRSDGCQKVVESLVNQENFAKGPEIEKFLQMIQDVQESEDFLMKIVLGQAPDYEYRGTTVLSPEFITLSTIHAAKGLEFPVVFINGLEEGTLPMREKDGSVNITEERRLFYVGITRAKKKLILTCAKRRKKYGRLVQTTPSRFIGEIPRELLDKVDLLEVDKAKQIPKEKQMSLF